ncbi:UDP-N-acetylmuramoyl-L-alanyl-D-glutamate--2,6-diaminopimelate ligase [Pleionea sp. CnH1-48]|uniref:UDP-N-acetylmuramoyl-L-alanyl-D-glutamate--2, 6-diaminopimelate ligase n=1 Tax=Pleionea sp. CnH1-48 TaxID=2954494 RepID=UPI0020969E41|nr:UDP-N-acetylmuramoyl-L-alanyl-D-glutamate--2,6-diaminopimelate ligase [Pleionea sp. CnH1-48]MCO7223997.1 UDP-N-acetylmuramoyl-L-alanyl-D-glutamate--2,6-diaminopimelate ligase [Pleionea sp. CnH1-48]
MAKVIDFNQVFSHWGDCSVWSGNTSVVVQEIQLDSRKVESGDAFVACLGYSLDGRTFIPKAVESGASLIICEANELDESVLASCQEANIACFLVPDLSLRLSAICGEIFGHPSRSMNVVGITGTNGKSSCAQLIAQAFSLLDGACWVLGTLGYGRYGNQQPGENTTTDPIRIQQELAAAVDANCHQAAMEVSSHGLVQHRVAAIQFDTAVFTNLTRDHLDYHQTMEAYADAKKQLFLQPELKWAVINADDRVGRQLKKDPSITANKLFISINEPANGADLSQWLWVENVQLTLSGISATVHSPWGSGKLKVPLIGGFNLYNLLSTIAVLGIQLKKMPAVMDIVNRLESVKGRMQLIQQSQQPLIVIDYAHTPDALEQALLAVREHCSGKIWCIFGCGGDRDNGKRPLMARVAEKLANKVIFTDDNPRTEAPEVIIEQMRAGTKKPDAIPYIAERKEAIDYAIDKAHLGDVILLAGKGHEDYQVIGKEKIFYSDIETAEQALARRSV